LALPILLLVAAQSSTTALLAAEDEWVNGPLTGNVFLEHCSKFFSQSTIKSNDDKDAVVGGFCVGYIVGLFQGVDSTQVILKSKFFCTPVGVVPSQMGRIAVKWLEEHPARLQESSGRLILLSWADAFRCGG
jgi:hypothetical protein